MKDDVNKKREETEKAKSKKPKLEVGPEPKEIWGKRFASEDDDDFILYDGNGNII